MKQVIRNSSYGDYIALDFLDEKNNIVKTPFYIQNKKEIEIHWATPSDERCEYPVTYDDWYERYLFKMENNTLYVAWLNGPCFANPSLTIVKPNELIDWKFQYATKIINK